jgi:hypothetical protein
MAGCAAAAGAAGSEAAAPEVGVSGAANIAIAANADKSILFSTIKKKLYRL